MTCAFIQHISTLLVLSASRFRVIIVCFTKEDVTVLLFSANIAACESENILIYCTLLCLVSMNFLQASFIAMISAWKTVVCTHLISQLGT